MRSLILLVVLTACAAERRWSGHAAADSWTTLPGIPLQLRVSKLDGTPGTITAVALPASSAEAPTGPAVRGTTLPVTIEGVACELSVIDRSIDTVARSQSTAEEKRRPGAGGTRELTFLRVDPSCGAHPVPGTDASLRGARAWLGMPWIALFLALGVLAGELASRRHGTAAVVTALAGFAGSVVLAFALFDGLYRVNYAMLYAAAGFAAIIAIRGDSWRLRLALLAGVVAGPVIAAAIWPLWNGFGPIIALVFGAIGGILGAVIATLAD